LILLIKRFNFSATVKIFKRFEEISAGFILNLI